MKSIMQTAAFGIMAIIVLGTLSACGGGTERRFHLWIEKYVEFWGLGGLEFGFVVSLVIGVIWLISVRFEMS